MTSRTTEHDDFIGRTAAFLLRQGLDAAGVEARLSATLGSAAVEGFRQRIHPRPGSFRAAFAEEVADLALPPNDINLQGLALEQSLVDAFRGLWRSLASYGAYLVAVAAVATTAFVVLRYFAMPNFFSALGSANERLSFASLFFESGFGFVPVLLLWAFAGWVLVSTQVARRAILLRHWHPRAIAFCLLGEPIQRHRRLLTAWAALTLVELGVPHEQALPRATAAVRRWCGPAGGAVVGDDEQRFGWAASLGTLDEELRHQVRSELVDAPLALATRRERLALYGSLVAAALVGPLLIAMYTVIFSSASIG
jgi:hypothetical protein